MNLSLPDPNKNELRIGNIQTYKIISISSDNFGMISIDDNWDYKEHPR